MDMDIHLVVIQSVWLRAGRPRHGRVFWKERKEEGEKYRMLACKERQSAVDL